MSEMGRTEPETVSIESSLPADSHGGRADDQGSLRQRVDDLHAELVEEREKRGEVQGDPTAQKLEDTVRSLDALTAQLEETRSELAASRQEQNRLEERASELETEVRLAEERVAAATDRLAQSEEELKRFRDQERALAETLVWARHAASEMSSQAEQEAARIVQDAERKATQFVSEAEREVDRLTIEQKRLEALANELEEDLSGLLLGTLERLKERVRVATGPDASARGTTAQPDEPERSTEAERGREKASPVRPVPDPDS